jgi:excisionase family DNA binding protein
MTDESHHPDTERPDIPDPDRAPDNVLSLQEASVWAGVNERTLRRWIKSGRLSAAKDDGQYRILVADLKRASQATTGGHPDTVSPGARTPGPDKADTSDDRYRTPDMSASDMLAVDLGPLADLIDDLTRRNADLAAAAAMWQTRAAHLENELKQLTAGELHAESTEDAPITPEPEPATMAPGSPPAGEAPQMGIWSWLRRLLGG